MSGTIMPVNAPMFAPLFRISIVQSSGVLWQLCGQGIEHLPIAGGITMSLELEKEQSGVLRRALGARVRDMQVTKNEAIQSENAK
jgi:hypothetical protein